MPRDIHAGHVRIRLHRPAAAASTAPVLLWAHGGGWAAGALEDWDAPLARIAGESGAVVAAVDYRLAPATRFPGPLQDLLTALTHLSANARSLGLDPSRMAVSGDSAGATLAAGAALATRDLRKAGRPLPRLVAQVLVHPPTDPSCDTASFRDYTRWPDRATMRSLWRAHLPLSGEVTAQLRAEDLGAGRITVTAAPLRARDLRDLPPAIIATAELDPVRDDGELYGGRLRSAGVPVRLRRFAGMTHAFLHHQGRLTLPRWLGEQLRPLFEESGNHDHQAPRSLPAALSRPA